MTKAINVDINFEAKNAEARASFSQVPAPLAHLTLDFPATLSMNPAASPHLGNPTLRDLLWL